MTEQLKRYDPDEHYEQGDLLCETSMHECRDGEWVRFSDHAAAVAALEKERDESIAERNRLASEYAILRMCYDQQNAAGNSAISERDAALARLAEVESALTAVTHAPIDDKAQNRLAALKQIASMALSQEKRGDE